jgi:hypothetical protein
MGMEILIAKTEHSNMLMVSKGVNPLKLENKMQAITSLLSSLFGSSTDQRMQKCSKESLF